MLCDLLARTGVAGVPESYARPASVADFARAWGVALDGEAWDHHYLDAVRAHGTGATGRFGMRIMGSDLVPFVQRLHALHPAVTTDTAVLRDALGIEHFIHLSRVDRVAQAVSLVLAKQTGLWHRNDDGSERQRVAPAHEPRYDHDQIAAELRMLDGEADGWRAWFASSGVTPWTITYEELCVDHAGVLAAVLGFLGAGEGERPTPATAPLATETNLQWCARFRAERSA